MIEVTTATPIYYFLIEFAKLVYAALPIMVIFLGMSFIIGSIRPEPWGVVSMVWGLFQELLSLLLVFSWQ